MSSQRAGCKARVTSSVKSCRSLRNSNSVITNVFSMKLVKGWMRALAKALLRSAFRGYVVETAARIKSASGVVNENLIQRMAAAAKRRFEFAAGPERGHFALMHNRDPVTVDRRLFQV